MRTLHLVNAWQPQGGGGITTFYRALLDQANEHGDEMVLVVPGERDHCEHRGATRTYTVAAPVTALNSRYRMIMPNCWPGLNRRVVDILRREQPDLLDVCDKYSLHYVAGLLRRGWIAGVRRPVLVGTSCERMDENMARYVSDSAWARRFCGFYLKWVYFGFFDHHITVSAHTAGELRQAARGHQRTRGVWILPMGAACERFGPRWANPDARQRLLLRMDASGESRVLVYAGRLAPEKNLPLLLDTFAQLLRRGTHDYRLAIAGDGMLRAQMEQDCGRRFRGAVSFLGNLGRDELPILLANADAFIHPNPAEPFGIAPLEAMASGLPLVACNSGGVLSYAGPDNAWLAPPLPTAMADAVDAVFADARIRAQRTGAAFQTARQHDWPAVAARFRRLYRDLTNGKAQGAVFQSTPGNWLGAEIPVPER
jgi:glycosyltransferase involved in cell wall biosynthesis